MKFYNILILPYFVLSCSTVKKKPIQDDVKKIVDGFIEYTNSKCQSCEGHKKEYFIEIGLGNQLKLGNLQKTQSILLAMLPKNNFNSSEISKIYKYRRYQIIFHEKFNQNELITNSFKKSRFRTVVKEDTNWHNLNFTYFNWIIFFDSVKIVAVRPEVDSAQIIDILRSKNMKIK